MVKVKFSHILRKPFFKWFLPVTTTGISIFCWFNSDYSLFMTYVGIFINLIGLIAWWVSKVTLAGNWDLGFGSPQAHGLVKRGIYSKISHPMYWGIDLTILGLIILYPKTWLAFIGSVIILYFYFRMNIETRYLLKTLGEEYRLYLEETWF